MKGQGYQYAYNSSLISIPTRICCVYIIYCTLNSKIQIVCLLSYCILMYYYSLGMIKCLFT